MAELQQMDEVMKVESGAGYSPFGGKSGQQEARIGRLEKMMYLQIVLLAGLFITQVVVSIVLSAKVDDFVVRATSTADDADKFMVDILDTAKVLDETAKTLNSTADDADKFMADILGTAKVLDETAKNLNSTADDADKFMADILETAKVLNETAKTISDPSSAAALISGTASTMILGNPNGSVAAYVQDMTEKDWGMLASKSLPLAEYIRDAMKAGAAGKTCVPQLATCPDTTQPYYYPYASTCANGAGYRVCRCLYPQYSSGSLCSPGYWQQDCGPPEDKECVMNGISDVAAAVASVLSKATVLERVTPEKDIGEAAMSQGLLRLDWMVDWAGKQGGQEGVSGYKTLAKQCKSFVNNILAVSWTGAFTDVEGRSQTWDAQSGVQDVTGWASTFCNALDY